MTEVKVNFYLKRNEEKVENPVQIDPVNQTNLTPCSKIRLPLLSKIKMTPLKCMSR